MSITPTRELHGVLGTRGRAACAHCDPGDDDEHDRSDCGRGRECDAGLGCSERDDDEHDLEPSSNTPLNATVNEYQSSPVGAPRRTRALSRSQRTPPLVVQRLVATRARIALRSHCSPNTSSSAPTISRSVSIGSGEAQAEHRHDHRESDCRGCNANQRRAPTTHDAYGKHDRQRLDSLHPTGKERREKEKEVVRHNADRRHRRRPRSPALPRCSHPASTVRFALHELGADRPSGCSCGPDHLHRPSGRPYAMGQPCDEVVPERHGDRDPDLPPLGRAHGGGRAGGGGAHGRERPTISLARGTPDRRLLRRSDVPRAVRRLAPAAARKGDARSRRSIDRRVPGRAAHRHDVPLELARGLHRHRDRTAQLLGGPGNRSVGGSGRAQPCPCPRHRLRPPQRDRGIRHRRAPHAGTRTARAGRSSPPWASSAAPRRSSAPSSARPG